MVDVRLTAGEKFFISFCHLLKRLLAIFEDFSRFDVGLMVPSVLILHTLAWIHSCAFPQKLI